MLFTVPALANEASDRGLKEAIGSIRGGNLGGALTLLRQANHADPRDVRVLYQMGVVLNRLDRASEAARTLEIAKRLDPAHRGLHYELGRSYLDLHRDRDALHELEAAQIQEPKRGAVFLALGSAQARLGQNEEAANSYRVAAALSPELGVDAHTRTGRLELSLGRWDLAQQEFEKALALRPDPETSLAVQGLLDTARQRGAADRWWSAGASLSQEVDSNPLLLGTGVPLKGTGMRAVVVPSAGGLFRLSRWAKGGAFFSGYQSAYEETPKIEDPLILGGKTPDLSVQSLSFGPVLSLRREGFPLGGEVRHSYAHTQFGGKAFTDSNTLSVAGRLAEGTSLLTELTGSLSDQRFDACDLQGTCGRSTTPFGNRSVGLQQYFLFMEQRGILRVGGSLESYDTPATAVAGITPAVENNEWSYWGGRVGAMGAVPLPYRTRLVGSFQWAYLDYFRQRDYTLAAPSIRARRRDQSTDTSLSVEWGASGNFDVVAGYLYSTNRSMGGIQPNPLGSREIAPGIFSAPYASTYTYVRSVVSVSLRARF